jgi:hypothetical protein
MLSAKENNKKKLNPVNFGSHDTSLLGNLGNHIKLKRSLFSSAIGTVTKTFISLP